MIRHHPTTVRSLPLPGQRRPIACLLLCLLVWRGPVPVLHCHGFDEPQEAIRLAEHLEDYHETASASSGQWHLHLMLLGDLVSSGPGGESEQPAEPPPLIGARKTANPHLEFESNWGTRSSECVVDSFVPPPAPNSRLRTGDRSLLFKLTALGSTALCRTRYCPLLVATAIASRHFLSLLTLAPLFTPTPASLASPKRSSFLRLRI